MRPLAIARATRSSALVSCETTVEPDRGVEPSPASARATHGAAPSRWNVSSASSSSGCRAGVVAGTESGLAVQQERAGALERRAERLEQRGRPRELVVARVAARRPRPARRRWPRPRRDRSGAAPVRRARGRAVPASRGRRWPPTLRRGRPATTAGPGRGTRPAGSRTRPGRDVRRARGSPRPSSRRPSADADHASSSVMPMRAIQLRARARRVRGHESTRPRAASMRGQRRVAEVGDRLPAQRVQLDIGRSRGFGFGPAAGAEVDFRAQRARHAEHAGLAEPAAAAAMMPSRVLRATSQRSRTICMKPTSCSNASTSLLTSSSGIDSDEVEDGEVSAAALGLAVVLQRHSAKAASADLDLARTRRGPARVRRQLDRAGMSPPIWASIVARISISAARSGSRPSMTTASSTRNCVPRATSSSHPRASPRARGVGADELVVGAVDHLVEGHRRARDGRRIPVRDRRREEAFDGERRFGR